MVELSNLELKTIVMANYDMSVLVFEYARKACQCNLVEEDKTALSCECGILKEAKQDCMSVLDRFLEELEWAIDTEW